MATIYSTYDAKAKFSEILRKVRSGQRIIVSYHGEQLAEIRPIPKKNSLEERIQSLESAGILSPTAQPKIDLARLAVTSSPSSCYGAESARALRCACTGSSTDCTSTPTSPDRHTPCAHGLLRPSRRNPVKSHG